MPSTNKSEREQRRAHRQALEAARAAKSARRRRLSVLGAALVAAAAVVAIATLVSAGPSRSATPTAHLTRSTVVDGVPETHGVLGNPKAPVTVTEYVDLQCPICAEASTTMLPTLVNDYVKTGKVKLQLRTLHFIGPDSVRAARVAAGARQQSKLWRFVETFYANQGTENSGYATDGFLKSVATTAGVNADAALAYAKSDAAARAIVTADRDAKAVGANATPTFTITKGNGKPHVLLVGAGDIHAALEKAL
ncbi:protein-disulfide isomerase [Solirubrobacter pauli]|uniref:Protein-disulfide isomerase n=1 Tax=Solirubrobacter pauli TaxID=166793 RepID=A0A660LEL1_9ACTN|nr:thioredoxin domain-containing protein [Solirubrobacter pauli]RKQ93009.1 protein-disulfide isomerase [Solirubrobacter pauli]